jgi:hypothetical protein
MAPRCRNRIGAPSPTPKPAAPRRSEGGLWHCDRCAAEVFSYRSCKNRSCPQCQTDQTKRWLAARRAEMLPTRYFHGTLRANQRDS